MTLALEQLGAEVGVQLREKQQLSLLQTIGFLFARPVWKAGKQPPHFWGTVFDVCYYPVGTKSAGAVGSEELLPALDIQEMAADTPGLPALPPLWRGMLVAHRPSGEQ